MAAVAAPCVEESLPLSSSLRGKGEFLERIVSGVLTDLHVVQTNNADSWRLGESGPTRLRRTIVDRVLLVANRAGFTRRGYGLDDAVSRLLHIITHADAFEQVYRDFGDERSRDVLVEILKFRILGARHVRLSLNTPEYWRIRQRVESARVESRGTRRAGSRQLRCYRFGIAPDAIELFADEATVLNTLVLNQYALRREVASIQPEPGDVVIDGGACWGDSALWFSNQVAPDGRVYAFECVPENLEVLAHNLRLNPRLAGAIHTVPRALWERSGETLGMSGAGPGSMVARASGADQPRIETVSIDDFVAAERLDRVDFLKMDIEGAEMSALRGATQTIERFHPKLAISVYHRHDDLIGVHQSLKKIRADYECFLDHFTIFDEETVLFARPASARSPIAPHRNV